MDGTGRLFGRLQGALPKDLDAQVISYPTNELLGYGALTDRVDLPREPFAIVAESFSGPIGIRLAASNASYLRALVLVASFAQCPISVPRFFGGLVGPSLARMATTPRILRATLLGREAGDDLVQEVRSVLRTVRSDVLAFRLREILAVDVADVFASNKVPTLYIRGRRDQLVRGRVVNHLSRLRPDLERIDFDAPHFVLQSKPAEAAAAIADFVRRTA
jgi:pimeloyl-[acyl-carrier protein] methyl ester esterase